MADFFNDPAQDQSVPMAAPGLPMGALSGNPWATLTNIKAIDAAQQGDFIGGAFGNAIAEAFGQPEIDPAQITANRIDQFNSDIDRGMAEGLSYGESMRRASKAGYLAPDERLRISQEAQSLLRDEQKVARDTSKALYNSDAYKTFLSTKNNWLSMKELAEKPPASINDFTTIQRFLKTIDPNSATLQGEINAAKLSATGMQSLKMVFGDSEAANIMANLMRFQAGGGQQLTLNREQKERLLQAAGEVLQASQRNALASYDQFQNQYLGTGGSQKMFDNVAAPAFNQLDFSVEGELAKSNITSGTMPNQWLGLSDMAARKRDKINQAITNTALDAAKYSAMFAADFAVGAATFGWEALQDLKINLFGPDADPADAAGAAMAIDPQETALQLEQNIGLGSTSLNLAQDIATGGKTSKMSGSTSLAPLVDVAKTAKKTKRNQRLRSGGQF